MTGVPTPLERLSRAVTPHNQYAGHVYRWVDGDTVDVLALDPIIGILVVMRVRLMIDQRRSVNAPDRGEAGYAEVKTAVGGEYPPGRLIVVTLFDTDKYGGRVDGSVDVTEAGDVSASEWLLDHGYAVPWDGTGVRPRVPWPPTTKGDRQ